MKNDHSQTILTVSGDLPFSTTVVSWGLLTYLLLATLSSRGNY